MRTMKRQPLDERSKYLRELVLTMIDGPRRGHVGSAYSMIELLRVLYDDILQVDPKNPLWLDRDRFILSKGNGCLGLYAILADKGFFDRKELAHFCHLDGLLGGHPEPDIPGVEVATGSLGHGLSLGLGMALAMRSKQSAVSSQQQKNQNTLNDRQLSTANRLPSVFILLGDGECNEGSVWEAALCAGKHHLDSLIVLVDYNHMQSYGTTEEVQDLEPFADKWRAFNWSVQELDGHDIAALRKSLKKLPLAKGRPTCLICHTVKGKGIGMIEANPDWHHKRGITDEEMKELKKQLEKY